VFGSNNEKVMFPCGKLKLEGVLHIPQPTGFRQAGCLPYEPVPQKAVVICHPHPLYGGNMHNSMIMTVATALGKKGLITLRFNFRGVGKSEGYFNDGIGEKEDVRAAISFLAIKVKPQKIGLGGYSFGTLVAFPVAVEEDRVQALAGISPFISPPTLLNDYHRPKYFISGKEDEYVNCHQLQEIVISLPEPKKLEIVAGADHFWWGEEEKVAQKVADFFKENL